MKKCCKFLGYGGIIWGVAFIVVSIFIGFKVSSQIIVQGITTLAVVITAFLLAKSLNVSTMKEMLKYSFSWVIVGLILDALITARFTGWEFFSRWEMWLGYLLILVVPLLAIKSEGKAA